LMALVKHALTSALFYVTPLEVSSNFHVQQFTAHLDTVSVLVMGSSHC